MATPTPSKMPHNQEMTPGSFANHVAAFSPLPTALRSVAQSPAHLSKRSPANAAALQHHHSSSAHSLPPLNFDSPGATALALSLNLPAFGGVASGNVRGAEEERKRRMDGMLSMLRSRPGRVSEEGIERLARRTGLEYLWDGQPGGPRMLSIAGTGVLIDVNFQNHEVTNVAISFLKTPEAPTVPAPRAAKILMQELRPRPGVSPINTTLTPFAAHLERLARQDKLSAPGLNCFEAIAGIHASLRRLFDHEKRKVTMLREADTTAGAYADDELLEKEVLCRHSGRPEMHARNRVGLSLEYWAKRRLVPRATKPMSDKTGTDASKEPPANTTVDADEDTDTWAAVIECESSPAALYPSVRVSESWLSDKIEKPAEERGPLFGPWDGSTLDWLEPPPTLISDSTTDAMAIDSGLAGLGRPPDVRFVARLEPPLVVPLSVAYEIYAAVGVQIPQESLQPTTFDGLLIPQRDDAPGSDGQAREIKRRRTLMVPNREDKVDERKHAYTLWVQKPEYGRVIEEIPFSHPRQLVSVLPTLRQYAALCSVIHNTLDPVSGSSGAKSTETTPTPTVTPTDDDDIVEESNIAAEDAELAALMSDDPPKTTASTEEQANALPVDIALSTQPTPKLTIVFPLKEYSANVVFEIQRGGEIRLTGENHWMKSKAPAASAEGVPARKASDAQIAQKQELSVTLPRALEISEDVGVFVEWALMKWQEK